MPFENFSKEKQYIGGIIFVTVGLFGLVGTFTGNLAGMLAALFDPSILVAASSSSLKITGLPQDSGGEPGAVPNPGGGELPGGTPGELPPGSPPAIEAPAPVELPPV